MNFFKKRCMHVCGNGWGEVGWGIYLVFTLFHVCMGMGEVRWDGGILVNFAFLSVWTLFTCLKTFLPRLSSSLFLHLWSICDWAARFSGVLKIYRVKINNQVFLLYSCFTETFETKSTTEFLLLYLCFTVEELWCV